MARIRANNASGGGGGGEAYHSTTYTAGTKIECSYAFSEVNIVEQRTDGITIGIHYSKSDPAKQNFFYANRVYYEDIDGASFSGGGQISEVGTDYIKLDFNMNDVYVVFA